MNVKVLMIFILENLRGIISVIWHDPEASPVGAGGCIKLLQMPGFLSSSFRRFLLVLAQMPPSL